MADPMRKVFPERGCPYLWQVDLEDRVVQGYSRDPVSGLTTVPGFWEYWNRCQTAKYVICPLYRRHRRQMLQAGKEARLA